MDPITTAIVAALSAQVPGVGKLIVTDAYNALKQAIRKRFGKGSKVDKAVQTLEDEPDFKPHQDALAGRVEQVGAGTDNELLNLAAALTEALKQSADGRAALSKFSVTMENSQVGVIGDGAHVGGGIHFGEKSDS